MLLLPPLILILKIITSVFAQADRTHKFTSIQHRQPYSQVAKALVTQKSWGLFPLKPGSFSGLLSLNLKFFVSHSNGFLTRSELFLWSPVQNLTGAGHHLEYSITHSNIQWNLFRMAW